MNELYVKPFKVGDTVTIREGGKAPKTATIVEVAYPAPGQLRYLCNWGTGILSHGWYPSTQVS